jgi:hypothetical protein
VSDKEIRKQRQIRLALVGFFLVIELVAGVGLYRLGINDEDDRRPAPPLAAPSAPYRPVATPAHEPHVAVVENGAGPLPLRFFCVRIRWG